MTVVKISGMFLKH